MQSNIVTGTAVKFWSSVFLGMGLIKKEPAAPEVVIVEPEVDTQHDV